MTRECPQSVELPLSPAAAAASPLMAYRLSLLAAALAAESVLRAARTAPLATNPETVTGAGSAFSRPLTQEQTQ